jgi:hypothetical protein
MLRGLPFGSILLPLYEHYSRYSQRGENRTRLIRTQARRPQAGQWLSRFGGGSARNAKPRDPFARSSRPEAHIDVAIDLAGSNS